jgi:hypothetical protein
MSTPRGYHDIGGLEAGPVEHRDPAPAEWAMLSEALRNAIQQKHRSITLDELRRTFETMGQELYEGLGFYERRVAAFARLLDEKGIVPFAETLARMDAMAAARGQRVDHTAMTVERE